MNETDEWIIISDDINTLKKIIQSLEDEIALLHNNFKKLEDDINTIKKNEENRKFVNNLTEFPFSYISYVSKHMKF